jgi:hypothetical protein
MESDAATSPHPGLHGICSYAPHYDIDDKDRYAHIDRESHTSRSTR